MIRHMCESIVHRGPDDDDVWINEALELAFGNGDLAGLFFSMESGEDADGVCGVVRAFPVGPRFNVIHCRHH